MSIRFLFEISKEFFDSMYSHFEEDDAKYINETVLRAKERQQEQPTREQPTREQPTREQDEEQQDEEKGWNQYEADDNHCYCNGCNIYRQIILFIDPNIDDNKFD
jgi:hypothetical protein